MSREMTTNLPPATLAERFQALIARNIKENEKIEVSSVYAHLEQLYTQTSRFYHDISHLAHCLREFDRAANLIKNPDAVELALWFHDAIYSVNAKDNELQSAELFRDYFNAVCEYDWVDNVVSLILSTKHNLPPFDHDSGYMQDIDLSSFGSDWPIYCADSLNLRRENAQLPDEAYYSAHRVFLNILLNRPRIFYTDHFYQCYEEIARRNIKQLLSTSHYMG